jgi:hypothetical protein
MSTFLFKGDPDQGGLPRKSNVRIEDAHTKAVVFEGRVHNSAHIELDPGKYCYSVVRLTGDPMKRKPDDVRYDGEFYFEVDEKAWVALRNMAPRLCRTINTSEGPRYRCLVSTCDDDMQFTTQMAALLHEVCDHMGIPREQFLANPVGARSKMGKYDALAADVSKAKNMAPRKSVVLGMSDAELDDERENPLDNVTE